VVGEARHALELVLVDAGRPRHHLLLNRREEERGLAKGIDSRVMANLLDTPPTLPQLAWPG
jgi:hypothetical protein